MLSLLVPSPRTAKPSKDCVCPVSTWIQGKLNSPFPLSLVPPGIPENKGVKNAAPCFWKDLKRSEAKVSQVFWFGKAHASGVINLRTLYPVEVVLSHVDPEWIPPAYELASFITPSSPQQILNKSIQSLRHTPILDNGEGCCLVLHPHPLLLPFCSPQSTTGHSTIS